LPEFSNKEANNAIGWYAISVQPNFEARTATDLQNLGFEVFYPRTSEWNRLKRVRAPLFPGYVFAYFEPTGIDQFKVLQARGAVSIVCDRVRRPEPVDPVQIQVLQRLVNSGLPLSRHPEQAAGDHIRIKCGVLSGIEGRLVRDRNECRLVVTLDVLGQSASVQVPTSAELERFIA
jgi:transcription antitermination factor NusG